MKLTRIEMEGFESQFRLEGQDAETQYLYTLLRPEIYFQAPLQKPSLQNKQSSRWKQLTSILRKAFSNPTQWFGAYDFLCFSNASFRHPFGDKLYEKNFEFLEEALPESRCLFIEEVQDNDDFPSRERIEVAHLTRKSTLDLPALILGRLRSMGKSPKQNEALRPLCDRFGIQPQRVWEKHRAYRAIYKALLGAYRPKAIFIHCWYTKIPLIEAAKSLSIPVIEIQHGLVGEAHSLYHCSFALPRILVPDHFLCWGEIDKEALSHGHFVEPENIHVVGNIFLEKIKSRKMSKLSAGGEVQKTRVLVSLQSTVEDELLHFVESLAPRLPDFEFWILPRGRTSKAAQSLNAPNVKVVTDSFYELIQRVDLHTTIFSTTAIEASAFHVPTVFFNSDGLAEKLFGTYISKSQEFFVADSTDDYIKIVSELASSGMSLDWGQSKLWPSAPKEATLSALRKIGLQVADKLE